MAHVRKHMVGKFHLLLLSHAYNFLLSFGALCALDCAEYEELPYFSHF